jgi:AraC-like DNA-binding protein
MSVSSLHHRFKAVTTMGPMQYQKQLRLQQARVLLLGGEVDATTAAYKVGYESASQFSREYRRLFGAPPMQDIKTPDYAMKINKKRLVPLGVGLFVLAIVGLLADIAWSVRQQQLDLITSFYKDHLARPEMRQASQLPTGSFFSKELEALVDANLQLCDSLSRGDDICGYGADGDVFLDTQEVPPTLDFERAHFSGARRR